MKALSLWEPFGSAMKENLKKNETRGWYLSYRGDLVICAAKKRPTLGELGGDRDLYAWTLKLNSFGNALCVVEVYDCQPSERFKCAERVHPTRAVNIITVNQQEWHLGDYSDRRWIIMTRNLRVLKTPVPVRGRQSLFDLSPEEEKAVRAELENT